jgi:hypothetical protein
VVRRAGPAAAVALAAVLGGCGGDQTAVLVHVCFGLRVPEDVAWVQLVVEHATRPPRSHVFAAPAGVDSATFSLRPGVDITVEEDFFLTVVGVSETGQQRVSRTVHTWFAPGVDRDVAVGLERTCLDVVCRAGETCGTGVCQPIPLAQEAFCPTE